MALNPHKNNKVDISSLSPEEQRLFRLYGKLPTSKDLLQNKLKERKYFDSGDYALSKAGKSDVGLVGGLGREHPSPESIPHLAPQQSQPGAPSTSPHNSIGGIPTLHPTLSQGGIAGSPVKEPSILAKGISASESEGDAVEAAMDTVDGVKREETEPRTELERAAEKQGVPIRK